MPALHRLSLLKLGAVAAAILISAPLAQAATPSAVSGGSLMTRDLIGLPGKEVTMGTVEEAPGRVGRPHRHNAQIFVYVLEGHVKMQVKGGPLETLGPGQTFYEGPSDIHAVSANASKTEPAKFLVLSIKDKGTPGLIPVSPAELAAAPNSVTEPPPEAKGGALMRRDVVGLPGKEVVLSKVEEAPGHIGRPHRHNAQVFVYVLEGHVKMQVKGGPLETLGPGQTFYENPTDIHSVDENASKTEPAAFLAFLIKDKDKPGTVPVTPAEAQ